MSSNLVVLLEVGLILGLVFAFGWHQLRDLKRYKVKESQQGSQAESQALSLKESDPESKQNRDA
jgi:predicted negative regulator of RcsB-dependent stress response